METKLINLCPHDITIDIGRGYFVVPKAKKPLRLQEQRSQVDNLDIGSNVVPVYKMSFALNDKLPNKRRNTYYIVSAVVKQACGHRKDIIVPSDLVRNERGEILGCKSFTV